MIQSGYINLHFSTSPTLQSQSPLLIPYLYFRHLLFAKPSSVQPNNCKNKIVLFTIIASTLGVLYRIVLTIALHKLELIGQELTKSALVKYRLWRGSQKYSSNIYVAILNALSVQFLKGNGNALLLQFSRNHENMYTSTFHTLVEK